MNVFLVLTENKMNFSLNLDLSPGLHVYVFSSRIKKPNTIQPVLTVSKYVIPLKSLPTLLLSEALSGYTVVIHCNYVLIRYSLTPVTTGKKN